MGMHTGTKLIRQTTYDKWLEAIDAEVEAMVHCVCKWPNFAPGVCMLCGRKEREVDVR